MRSRSLASLRSFCVLLSRGIARPPEARSRVAGPVRGPRCPSAGPRALALVWQPLWTRLDSEPDVWQATLRRENEVVSTGGLSVHGQHVRFSRRGLTGLADCVGGRSSGLLNAKGSWRTFDDVHRSQRLFFINRYFLPRTSTSKTSKLKRDGSLLSVWRRNLYDPPFMPYPKPSPSKGNAPRAELCLAELRVPFDVQPSPSGCHEDRIRTS